MQCSVLIEQNNDIFNRLKSGEPIRLNDPEYSKIQAVVGRTLSRSSQLNNSGDVNVVRDFLSDIIEKPIDESTTIFPPFYVNFGRFITLGKNILIYQLMPLTANHQLRRSDALGLQYAGSILQELHHIV